MQSKEDTANGKMSSSINDIALAMIILMGAAIGACFISVGTLVVRRLMGKREFNDGCSGR